MMYKVFVTCLTAPRRVTSTGPMQFARGGKMRTWKSSIVNPGPITAFNHPQMRMQLEDFIDLTVNREPSEVATAALG